MCWSCSLAGESTMQQGEFLTPTIQGNLAPKTSSHALSLPRLSLPSYSLTKMRPSQLTAKCLYVCKIHGGLCKYLQQGSVQLVQWCSGPTLGLHRNQQCHAPYGKARKPVTSLALPLYVRCQCPQTSGLLMTMQSGLVMTRICQKTT